MRRHADRQTSLFCITPNTWKGNCKSFRNRLSAYCIAHLAWVSYGTETGRSVSKPPLAYGESVGKQPNKWFGLLGPPSFLCPVFWSRRAYSFTKALPRRMV